jgi:lipopolysaccharide transport system permease protein
VNTAAELLLPARPAAGGAYPAGPSDVAPEPPVTVIEHRPGWRVLGLAELWRFRELLYYLVWRDVKVRYKQTVLGATWAVLQPLATMLAFTLFLGPLVSGPAGDVPYPLFVFAGLLPWTFLANAVGTGGQSILANERLVTKIHFPRLIIPMSAVGAGLVDFAVAFGLLGGLMVFYGVAPGWGALLVPLLALGLVALALGAAVLLSALTVAYRDFRHAVPFLVQFWMFATPCIFVQAQGTVGSWVGWLLPINPAYGLIANFRAALLGGPLDLYALAVSGAVSGVLLVAGCTYFRRVERGFADVI